MPFELPDLPYAKDALEPHYSANTIDFHHGKHHATYVATLNKLLDGSAMADQSLEEIIGATRGDAAKTPVFNNAAQIWNHTFFWNSMTPGGGGKPEGELGAKIAADFGSYEDFVEAFVKTGLGRFGSGWVWLVQTPEGKLKVINTLNAETPVRTGERALLTCDVWEHAYYLDYQNKREAFLRAFLDKLANWKFAADNMAG